MTEFLVTTDLAPLQSLSIDANFDEMEKELTSLMEPYKSLVVTDVKAAKDARAYCNKVKKTLDDTRKQIKKLWMSPYSEFEEKVKHLTAICDDASTAIDAQVKSIEDTEKAERRAKIESYFNKQIGEDLKQFCSIDAVWDDKWLNKTADPKQTAKEISDYISGVVNDLCAIEALGEDHRDVLRREYSKTHSMAAVNDLYRYLCVGNASTPKEVENAVEAKQTASGSKPAKKHKFTLEFTCTVSQAHMINEFFEDNNISFRRVN